MGSSRPSRSTHTSVRARFAEGHPAHVDERPVGGHGEIGSAVGVVTSRGSTGTAVPRSRAARDRRRSREASPQRRRRDGRWARSGAAPAAQQHLLRAGPQVEHGHLGVIDAAGVDDREEDGWPPGRISGQTWSASPCARSGRVSTVVPPPAADTRWSPVAAVRLGREDDRVVARPTSRRSMAVRRACSRSDGAAVDRDLLATRSRRRSRPTGRPARRTGRVGAPLPASATGSSGSRRGRTAACRCCRRRRRASRPARWPGRGRSRTRPPGRTSRSRRATRRRPATFASHSAATSSDRTPASMRRRPASVGRPLRRCAGGSARRLGLAAGRR